MEKIDKKIHKKLHEETRKREEEKVLIKFTEDMKKFRKFFIEIIISKKAPTK